MPTSASLLFDPTDPEVRRNPYPVYRRMRSEAPAWQSPTGVWYFTRYQDALELLRNQALSYDSTATRQYERSLSVDPVERAEQLEQTRRSRSLLDMDPPDHTRVRSVINRAFTAPVVEASRPVVERYVQQLLAQFDGPRVDLVENYASILPIMVICDMLGVPLEERHTFRHLSDRVARSIDPDVPTTEKLAASDARYTYIASLIEQRRHAMGNDLMSRLIEASEDGRLANEQELVRNTGTLLGAGFETTTNLITNGVFRLLQFPAQLARLKSDPGLIRTCIEEVLRFDPPVQFMRPRAIVGDTVVCGVELHPGDAVVPLLAAANRDPDEFPEPEVLDIGRNPNRHLSFGVGHHLCVGAALARMEAQIAVLRLFDWFPDLTLSAEDTPEYRPNIQLRGFSKLPVVLG